MLIAANKCLPSGMDFSEAIVLLNRVIHVIYTFKQGASNADGSLEKEIDFSLFGRVQKDHVYGAQYIGMALEISERLKEEHTKKRNCNIKLLVTIPECVDTVIKEYQQSNNPMEEFLNANVVK
jgi:hypothetical protein